MARPPHTLRVVLGLAILVLPAPAQDDLRDTVTLKQGRPVRGRVLEPFGEEEVVVLQGQRRVRLPRRDVTGMDTVRDRLRELVARRLKLPDDVRWQWTVAEWAKSQELPRMAALQAWSVLSLDADHEQARALLGHRRSGKQWQIQDDGTWYLESKLAERHADWGKALVLDSEHFRLRSNGGVKRVVAALWDLEALYVWWFDTYGPVLRPREVIPPMQLHVWASEEKFPGWTEMRIPYFIPAPYDDTGYTFFPPNSDRPRDLFGMGLQHILYRSLAYDQDCGSYKNRRCAWLELGLGQYADALFQGPPGRAQAGAPPVFPHERAQIVVQKKRYELKHLLHRHVRDSFYAAVAETTPIDWAYAHAFVTFLMEGEDTRPRLMEYLRQALREAKTAAARSIARWGAASRSSRSPSPSGCSRSDGALAGMAGTGGPYLAARARLRDG
jgi:hypothetical protein